MVTCQFAIYVLKTDAERDAVARAVEALKGQGVAARVGRMGTEFEGEPMLVFNALRHAFEAVAGAGPTVLTATISNACPEDETEPWADPSPA